MEAIKPIRKLTNNDTRISVFAVVLIIQKLAHISELPIANKMPKKLV